MIEDSGGFCDGELFAEQDVDDALRVVTMVDTNNEAFAIVHAVVRQDGMAGEDRVAVALAGGQVLIAVADGAGGTGRGGAAAELVVHQIDTRDLSSTRSGSWPRPTS